MKNKRKKKQSEDRKKKLSAQNLLENVYICGDAHYFSHQLTIPHSSRFRESSDISKTPQLVGVNIM